MKKYLAVVGLVLGVFLALRYMERPIPPAQHPPQPPAPTVPEGLTPTAPPTTTEPGQPPSGPVFTDLDALLASVERWKAVPDLRQLTARCVASPQDKLGPIPKEASGEFTPGRALERLLEEVLCSGNVQDCARIKTMVRPPELGRDRPGNTPFMTRQSCRDSVVNALYVRSLAEGRPSEAYCREWLLHFFDSAPLPEELSQLCGMLASDSSTGGRSYCTALREKYSLDDHNYEHCLDKMHFMNGEQACVDALKDPIDRDLCLGLARVYSAARSRDLSKCKETVIPGIKPKFAGADRVCLAVMGDPQICKAVEGVESAKTQWVRRQCPAWAIEQMEAWVRDVDANAQFAIDQLPKEKRRLASLGPGDSLHAPKIDAAMISAKEALKSMEAIRDKMNKGQLPGQSASGGGG